MRKLVYRKAKRTHTEREPVRHPMHITKGDTVQVISGDDKGKQGKVIHVYPKTARVKIQGVNIVTKHQRQTQTAEAGKVTREAPIHHSKVMLVDPKSGEPTRIRRRHDADGKMERIAVKSGQLVPRSR